MQTRYHPIVRKKRHRCTDGHTQMRRRQTDSSHRKDRQNESFCFDVLILAKKLERKKKGKKKIKEREKEKKKRERKKKTKTTENDAKARSISRRHRLCHLDRLPKRLRRRRCHHRRLHRHYCHPFLAVCLMSKRSPQN